MNSNDNLIEQYKKFLDNGKTERECVEELIAMAKKAGYKDLNACKKLKAGDKVYITKMNKAIALFQLGSEPLEKGMNKKPDEYYFINYLSERVRGCGVISIMRVTFVFSHG